jgi:hypothetical protein
MKVVEILKRPFRILYRRYRESCHRASISGTENEMRTARKGDTPLASPE